MSESFKKTYPFNIISIKDLGRKEIESILDDASRIADGLYPDNALNGKILALLFFEPSTRTRMSFEAAMARLGGRSINLDSIEASSLAKGETLADTIRVVSGYADIIVLRHPSEGAARLASEFARVPVINAGDGAGQHPSQTLLDLYTIKQAMPIDKIDIGLLGDLRYGRTAHSLAYALSLFNARIHTLSPRGLELPDSILNELEENGTEVIPHEEINEVIPLLDVLYVTRLQRERFPDSASYVNIAKNFRITPEILESAKDHLILLHPLPRVDEIDPQVDELPCAKYFEQSKNGVPVRMAMLMEMFR